jgi:amino acid adenylation domain-containing protein
MDDRAKQIASLPPDKLRALLRQLSNQRAQPKDVIKRQDRSAGAFGLSFAQQRLWFLHQLDPINPSYNLSTHFRLIGKLDVEALTRAIDEIVKRHEVFRTSFVVRDGEPVQVVLPHTQHDTPVVDLSAYSESEGDEEAVRLATAEARRPFDLAAGKLLRSSLLRLGETEHVLLVCTHHIIFDARSAAVFVNELAILYAAFSANKPFPLPELPLQYLDFAVWQREAMESEALKPHLEYWQQQLANINVLELPMDHPRPAVFSLRGAQHRTVFPKELAASLKDLAQSEGATLFMLLLAAFQLLLHRYSGQNDISVGVPIAGRNRRETEDLIGCFINMLVMRADLNGSPTFRDLLRKVKKSTLEAFDHQQAPFERLVSLLQPQRDLSTTPLFQVLFQLKNMRSDAGEDPQLRIEPLEIDRGRAQNDLNLEMSEEANGLSASVEYASDLFDHDRIVRMMDHFQVLLSEIAANPDRSIADLKLLPEAERVRLVEEFNATAEHYPADFIHDIIEGQARLTPSAIAVEFENDRLNYRELDEQANRLAHYLIARGVETDSVVGVMMERSIEMVVSLLAILKAGAAYLPLDPDLPDERLRFMLSDLKPRVILTKRQWIKHDAPPATIILDEIVDELSRCEASRPEITILPENLAYAIYTSGSTGRPKAAANTHGAIANSLLWGQSMMRLETEDVVVQKTPFSFDVSVWEFFWPLMTGARLVMAKPGGHRDPHYLAGLFSSRRVTTAHFVPSMLEAFVASGAASQCTSLRRVVCSGEALAPALAEELLRQLPGIQLFNLYGPTEAAVHVSWWLYEKGAAVAPIGRPIANVSLYVLDPRMGPAPIGVPGEIYIGGVGLARGYENRADLTAERFVPDPFSHVAGQRLYRTGDLGRYSARGEIEYLGRIDAQVKVRGVRIEPGEIEHALMGHPDVRSALVMLREFQPGDRRLVAYVVADSEQPSPDALRRHLRDKLPEALVPSHFAFLESFPLTNSGKIDRRAFPLPDSERPKLETEAVLPETTMEQRIAELWQQVLRVDRIGVNDNFFDLGGHSLLLAQMHSKFEEVTGHEVTMVDLFRYPNIRSLAAFLSREQTPQVSAQPVLSEPSPQPSTRKIAIVGMSCRFPGANNVNEFWENLRAGKEGISFFTDEEMIAAGVDTALLRNPNFVKARGMLEGIDLFDASFFGFNPREAEVMDPQHRLFLENTWAALEDSGTDPSTYKGRIGVYAGAGLNAATYMFNLIYNTDFVDSVGRLQTVIGNDKDFLATRVSYKLNLTGPSFTVQTACSTSLVAVHLAAQSLLAGECEMAIAGGVSISAQQQGGYLYQEGSLASPDGHCRAFDADAKGTIFSSGLGVVVLKRLEDALADGNPIYAVILGSAINNDGSTKVGYTAPSVEGQARVIQDALHKANVNPKNISYVEAHGTGTALGDPIEFAALTKCFRAATDKKQFCALGSVKTNIGHTDAAAGVAGLIKTSLSLKHRLLPASLHFRTPNPSLDIASSPFVINAETRAWNANGNLRLAGVSAFGMGGTNAHVVLEEAPPELPSGSSSRKYQLLILSARSETALARAATRLADHLEQNPDQSLADVSYTLAAGRKTFAQRLALVCEDIAEAVEMLHDPASEIIIGNQELSDVPVTFMFPGSGAQYPNMGLDLYHAEPEFKKTIDDCCELLQPHLGFDLRDYLYPTNGRLEEATAQLRRVAVAFPALFVTEYALAKLWMSWGFKPHAVIGHSLGEYVAACLASVFSIEDALALVAARGRLMQDLPSGSMLSVTLPEKELSDLIPAPLSIAAVNGPSLCVVSGPAEEIDKLEATLTAKGTELRRIHIDVAAHSSLVEQILDKFTKIVAGLRLNPPSIPYLSNVTGTWTTKEQVTEPRYWADHLRQTVRFGAGVEELLRGPKRILLEVGPGQTLTSLIRQNANVPKTQVTIPSLRHSQETRSDVAFILRSIAQLWLAGATVQWPALYATEKRRLVSLPTYAFDRQRYWIEPSKDAGGRVGRQPSLRRVPDLADWFYIPAWTRTMRPKARVADEASGGNKLWLVFSSGHDVAAGLVSDKRDFVSVFAGDRYEKNGDGSFTIDVERREDYERLFSDLGPGIGDLEGMLHLFPTTVLQASGAELFEQCQKFGYYSVLFLVQAIAAKRIHQPIRLIVVTENALSVHGDQISAPETAPMLGALKVAAQEYQNLTCRYIDVSNMSSKGERITRQLLSELESESVDAVVAYRGHQRLVQTFQPVRLEADAEPIRQLHDGGTYLITGGLGRVGLLLAESFARRARVNFVLTARSEFPPRADWEQWLEAHGEENATSRTIKRLIAIEAMGSQVMTVRADAGDEEQMRATIETALNRFGKLNGVIHAAGVTKGSSIFQKIEAIDREESETQFRSKVHGLYVLEKVLSQQQLDFCMLMSSNASVLGGLGMFAYAAANSFVDSFVQSRSQTSGFPWISTNWDVWLDEERSAPAMRESSLDEYSMSPSESTEAFWRILSQATVEQVVVSGGDLSARLKVWIEKQDEAETPDTAQGSHERPLLRNSYVPPETDCEQKVAAAWQRILGIEQIGVNDNFFELGGHSLLATRLISRLRDSFAVELPLASIFESPTIARLAKIIEELLAEEDQDRAPALLRISRDRYRVNKVQPQS